MAFQGILLRYSGGVGNTNRDFSLGGKASQVNQGGIVSPQSMTLDSALAGVDLCMSRGNPVGAGTLIWHPDTRELMWIPYGTVSTQSDAGPAPLLLQTLNMPPNEYPPERYTVKVSGNGYYELGGATKKLIVYVTEASLPTSRAIRTLTIADNEHNIFDTISYSENTSGDTEFRCLYMQNLLSDIVWLRVSITSQPTNCTISVANEWAGNPPWPMFSVGEAEGNVDGDMFLETNAPTVKSWEEMQISSDLFAVHPHVQFEDGEQTTNGLVGDVAFIIAGESDPTSQLAALQWGTTLQFNYPIASGNMLSVWFKRVKASGVVDPTTDTFQFKIEYFTEVTVSPW